MNYRIARTIQELIILFFMILFISQSFGAPPPPQALTLEEAQTEGLTQSPQIQKLKAQVEEAHWKKVESLSNGFLPKLSVSGAHYFTTQYTNTILSGLGPSTEQFPGFYPNTTLSIDVSLPLFDGLANIRNLKATHLEEEAAKKELSRAEFQLKKEIQLAFYQALAANQLDTVAEENVKTLEDHYHQVTILNKGGSVRKYDVLRVEVQLSDARADAIDAKDNVMLTRKKLNQLLAIGSDDRILTGDLPIPDPIAIKDLEDGHIAENREDIQSLNLRADAAGESHGAHQAWISPNISLGGQYLFYDQQKVSIAPSSITNTGTFQGAYNVGVFLKWNLFDGGASIARSQQASYREIQAIKAVETAKNTIVYDFNYWKRKYLSNSDHYLSKNLDISRSQESVRLAKEEERAGSRTSTETLDAELDLFRAKAGSVTARLNAAEARIRLELVLGRTI
jgi:outer membrane protein TolC